MLGLNTAELVIILVIVLLIFGWTQFKNTSGPSNGPKSGFEFQTIGAPASVVAHCPKCGVPTKGFYENCPVCGEKLGEKLAVAKTL